MNIPLQGSILMNVINRKYALTMVAALVGVAFTSSLIWWVVSSYRPTHGQTTQSPPTAFSQPASTSVQTVPGLIAPQRDASPSPSLPAAGIKDLGLIGSYQQDSKIEILLPLEGAANSGAEVNPFEIDIKVTFTGPAGQTYSVPAFFDGDGVGGQEGNIWKARFYADSLGEWSFTSSSEISQLAGFTGNFIVEASTGCHAQTNGEPQPLTCLGTLQYAGGYYLRFRNGDLWIKGGIDDPENFIGDAFGDWDAKKDAVDFLSSKGVNSIYVITNNIDGDRKDTWPWVGDTPQEAKQNSNKFNVAKLQEWEDFFTYVESKGIVLHLILNDDSAWNGYDHELYFKEMIARFGHHPGLIWNVGEEADEIYTDAEQVDLAKLLKSLDPYGHPVTVHRKSPWPFIGNPYFDLTSLQPINGAQDFTTADLRDQNRVVISHREQSASTCRPIPIMIDELPRVTRVDETTRFKMRAEVLYPIYFGGGNFELHYHDAYGQGGQVTIQQLAPMLEDMARARRFVESLPFNQMRPCNELVSGQGVFCYGSAGGVYVVYLSQGGPVSVNLSGAGANFDVSWFDPRTGASSSAGSVMGGGNRSFTAPSNQDWVLKLHNTQLEVSQPTIGGGFSSLIVLTSQTDFKNYLPALMQCGG